MALAARVLEIGCGTGRVTSFLVGEGANVLAIDPSRDMVERARELSSGWGKQGPGALQLLVSTFEDAKLEPGSFDGVVASQSMHWTKLPESLGVARSLLRPGGILVLAWNFLDVDACPPLRRAFDRIAERVDVVRQWPDYSDSSRGDFVAYWESLVAGLDLPDERCERAEQVWREAFDVDRVRGLFQTFSWFRLELPDVQAATVGIVAEELGAAGATGVPIRNLAFRLQV